MKLNKKDCIVMLLAGGQGSRLGALTDGTAKPSVPFGGKYRIIDFALSNSVNSGLDTIGVLTQYQPLVLNSYLGDGSSWDLDRMYGGIQILPPYQGGENGGWYSGTANSVYQNVNYVNNYDPDYVLILSGDHIYTMDYSIMLEQHRKTNADCTVSVINVPAEEASRFGILSADNKGRITAFEEKPKNPKSTLASMGIYIFTWHVLEKFLAMDDKNPDSSHDFGKNIIPLMLEAGAGLYAHEFEGYWKDVGTIESLWQANMDLVEGKDLQLSSSWPIYSRNPEKPPHYIGCDALVKNSIIADGAVILGHVENSVIFSSVNINENACVRDSIVMSDVIIEKNAIVEYSIIDERVTIGPYTHVGHPRSQGGMITVIPREQILNGKETE
ncbi:glucose-1-phosphate adenylyltransferase [Parasporobacterium paucivorans]|uniref:Glucose-1-phosphate adenylyltransferase n=1 Tax=Parasporobacterium paucivorans DSM 15970 TaxID=1122934 RepID=A0A1M6G650_9FIRM|nr:glucose-1-phosphate adenylyltransferase [Parasporobacterium paucivorans]SHJ05373.1 glucose-1-phosphate adenylyltransferase [Parasporobacterium paucivorans DSM 15970]